MWIEILAWKNNSIPISGKPSFPIKCFKSCLCHFLHKLSLGSNVQPKNSQNNVCFPPLAAFRPDQVHESSVADHAVIEGHGMGCSEQYSGLRPRTMPTDAMQMLCYAILHTIEEGWNFACDVPGRLFKSYLGLFRIHKNFAITCSRLLEYSMFSHLFKSVFNQILRVTK